MQDIFAQQYDFIVVGGGTVGIIIASRLPERATKQVLLIEPGWDTPPRHAPADIDDIFPSSTVNPALLWQGLKAPVKAGQAPRPYPQGEDRRPRALEWARQAACGHRSDRQWRPAWRHALRKGMHDMLAQAIAKLGKPFETAARDFVRAQQPSSIIQRASTVKEVTNLAVHLASPLSLATTGASLRVDGGVVKSIA